MTNLQLAQLISRSLHEIEKELQRMRYDINNYIVEQELKQKRFEEEYINITGDNTRATVTEVDLHES
jgi:hypothetical protein